MKRNGSKRLSIGDLDGDKIFVKNALGREDPSAQMDGTVKLRRMSYAFFELTENMLQPLLAKAIDLFASKLLGSLEKVLPTERNAARH